MSSRCSPVQGTKANPSSGAGLDDYMAPFASYFRRSNGRELAQSYKVDNCQIGVSMTYVGQGFAWPYAMDLFIPESRRHKGNGQFELRYFFSNMPQDMPTLEIVRLSHERFWIKQGYQQLKEELGLDHHEGRSWIGWYRHVLLVFLAFGYLTRLRIQEKKHRQQILWKERLFPEITEKTSNSH